VQKEEAVKCFVEAQMTGSSIIIVVTEVCGHCNTLTTHCNTLRHTATRCNTLVEAQMIGSSIIIVVTEVCGSQLQCVAVRRKESSEKTRDE